MFHRICRKGEGLNWLQQDSFTLQSLWMGECMCNLWSPLDQLQSMTVLIQLNRSKLLPWSLLFCYISLQISLQIPVFPWHDLWLISVMHLWSPLGWSHFRATSRHLGTRGRRSRWHCLLLLINLGRNPLEKCFVLSFTGMHPKCWPY